MTALWRLQGYKKAGGLHFLQATLGFSQGG